VSKKLPVPKAPNFPWLHWGRFRRPDRQVITTREALDGIAVDQYTPSYEASWDLLVENKVVEAANRNRQKLGCLSFRVKNLLER
jgi:hypothetical protein